MTWKLAAWLVLYVGVLAAFSTWTSVVMTRC
jgi:hypothetical protein